MRRIRAWFRWQFVKEWYLVSRYPDGTLVGRTGPATGPVGTLALPKARAFSSPDMIRQGIVWSLEKSPPDADPRPAG